MTSHQSTYPGSLPAEPPPLPHTAVSVEALVERAGTLFEAGLLEEGRLMYAAAHTVAAAPHGRLDAPRVTVVQVCGPDQPLPPESGHRFQPLQLLPSPPEDAGYDPELPQQWIDGFRELERDKAQRAGYDEFQGGQVLCLMTRNQKGIEFHQWFFSAGWQLFCENPLWLPYFRNNGAGFRFLSADRRHYLMDLQGAARGPVLPGRYLYLGSSQYWGHWILDFLPLVLHYQELFAGQGVKLVCGPLSRVQRKTLACLGVAEESLIEIEIPQDSNAVYGFETLIRPRELPGLVGSHFLRSRFLAAARRAGASLPGVVPGAGLFLSRQHLPVSRVVNEAELGPVCARHGVETVQIETLSFEEQLIRLAGAPILVFSFGSELGNTVFCPEDTVVVLLLSRVFLDTPENSTYDDTFKRHLLGSGLHVIPVWGTPLYQESPDQVFKSSATVEIPCRYDPRELEAALEKAHAWRAARAGEQPEAKLSCGAA